MAELLILADDFTGALDTGVQFAVKGISTLVTLQWDARLLASGISVLTVDLETRHLSPNEAKQKVLCLTQQAIQAGVPYFYKKTDSTLRGNVGSELAGMMQALNSDKLAFVPAFPKMGRTTQGGVQFCNGIELDHTTFRLDPCDPMLTGNIPEILHKQTPIPTKLIPLGASAESTPSTSPCIYIYDAVTDSDLHQIALSFQHQGIPKAMAGCAGFAQELPTLLQLPQRKPSIPARSKRILTVSGSVNATTFAQLQRGIQDGLSVHLPGPEMLEDTYCESADAQALVNELVEEVQCGLPCVLTCAACPADRARTLWYANSHGIDEHTVPFRIAARLGQLTQMILCESRPDTIAVFGGDTLYAIMQRLACTPLEPCDQIFPGVVRSIAYTEFGEFSLVSKAGGFGDENLLAELYIRLTI